MNITTQEEIAILERAKNVIMENGWSTGDYVQADGSVCAVGALYGAMGYLTQEEDGYWTVDFPPLTEDPARQLAANLVALLPESYLELDEVSQRLHSIKVVFNDPDDPGQSWGEVTEFNDHFAESPNDIIELFDRGIIAAKERAK